jgi:hypothetical protein
MSQNQPFAYSTEKSGFTFSIRPTFLAAVQAARERYDVAISFLIDIRAWFEDGRSVLIPNEALIIQDEEGYEVDWISDEAALELQARLFALDSYKNETEFTPS